jgi:hypothetical protein
MMMMMATMTMSQIETSVAIIQHCRAFMMVYVSLTQSHFFKCCFTVHFDKFKAFLPTNALFIKT